MEDKELLGLYEAYLDVYELDEVTGRGRIDPQTGNYINRSRQQDKPNRTEHGRSADLAMPPKVRAEKRAKALRSRGTPEATRNANRIDKFVKSADTAHLDQLSAASAARTAEKKRLMNPQESYDIDLFDYLLEYLVAEGYADTEESATAIMVNMSEDWRQSIVEEMFDEEKKEFPSDKAKKQSAKHMRNYITRSNSYVGQRARKKSAKMDAIRSTVEVGDDPRNTMHGQDLRKI